MQTSALDSRFRDRGADSCDFRGEQPVTLTVALIAAPWRTRQHFGLDTRIPHAPGGQVDTELGASPPVIRHRRHEHVQGVRVRLLGYAATLPQVPNEVLQPCLVADPDSHRNSPIPCLQLFRPDPDWAGSCRLPAGSVAGVGRFYLAARVDGIAACRYEPSRKQVNNRREPSRRICRPRGARRTGKGY